MQKNWNAKLLAFGGNTPQVFWCKDVVGGLAGFKGKKVRVFNNTMRDFLAASARPPSAWRSPKWCRRSAPAWWIAA